MSQNRRSKAGPRRRRWTVIILAGVLLTALLSVFFIKGIPPFGGHKAGAETAPTPTWSPSSSATPEPSPSDSSNEPISDDDLKALQNRLSSGREEPISEILGRPDEVQVDQAAWDQLVEELATVEFAPESVETLDDDVVKVEATTSTGFWDFYLVRDGSDWGLAQTVSRDMSAVPPPPTAAASSTGATIASTVAGAGLVGLVNVAPRMSLRMLPTGHSTNSSGTCPTAERLAFADVAEGSLPVVLVHGWTGTAESMHSLGEAIKDRADMATAVRYFDYHSDSLRWASEPEIAACLAEYLHEVTEQAGRPAVVVAHSMGGIAVRFASDPLHVERPLTSDQVSDIVTLGTPHRGSPWGGSIGAEVKQLSGFLSSWGEVSQLGKASRCLAPHDGITSSTTDCDIAPYIPTGTNMTQIDGANLMHRNVLNHRLWTTDQRGDGIVLADSASGYPGSAGQPTPTGYTLDYATLQCEAETSLLTQWLITSAIDRNFITAWLRTLYFEQNMMDSFMAGRLDLASAPPWLVTTIFSDCSHTKLMDHPKTLDHVLEVLGRASQWEGLSDSDPVSSLDDLHGTWVGDVDQPGSSAYSVRITFDSDTGITKGTVQYPELGCSGDWTLLEQDGSSAVFAEKISSGSRCVPEVTVRLTLRDDGRLDYRVVDQSDPATAILDRTTGAMVDWPVDRQDGDAALRIWLGATAAWPDAPDISYPTWVSCDRDQEWCLLGGEAHHTLVRAQPSHQVMATVSPFDLEAETTLMDLGVSMQSAREILGSSP